MRKTVTITIPSYKQEQELRRSLTSLTFQTFKDFTDVIIDDNSGCDLSLITKDYPSLEIIVVHNHKNLGAMKNLEYSILFETDSKYILSHHEDDYLVTNYLERAVAILEKNSDVSFVTCEPRWVSRQDAYVGHSITNIQPLFLDAQEFMRESLMMRPFMFGSAVYRTKDLSGQKFELEKYYTLCDKIFLSSILITKKTFAAHIPEQGICVTDHSKEKKDTRSEHSKPEHFFNYFSFYHKHLAKNKENQILISNSTLLGIAHMHDKYLKNIGIAYKKDLFKIALINKIGFYACFIMLFGKKNAKRTGDILR